MNRKCERADRCMIGPFEVAFGVGILRNAVSQSVARVCIRAAVLPGRYSRTAKLVSDSGEGVTEQISQAMCQVHCARKCLIRRDCVESACVQFERRAPRRLHCAWQDDVQLRVSACFARRNTRDHAGSPRRKIRPSLAVTHPDAWLFAVLTYGIVGCVSRDGGKSSHHVAKGCRCRAGSKRKQALSRGLRCRR
jgi:hypothetical protein